MKIKKGSRFKSFLHLPTRQCGVARFKVSPLPPSSLPRAELQIQFTVRNNSCKQQMRKK